MKTKHRPHSSVDRRRKQRTQETNERMKETERATLTANDFRAEGQGDPHDQHDARHGTGRRDHTTPVV